MEAAAGMAAQFAADQVKNLVTKVIDNTGHIIALSRGNCTIDGDFNFGDTFTTVPDELRDHINPDSEHGEFRIVLSVVDKYRIFGQYQAGKYPNGKVDYKISTVIPLIITWEAGWEAGGILHVYDLSIHVGPITTPLFIETALKIHVKSFPPKPGRKAASIRITISEREKSRSIGTDRMRTGSIEIFGDGSVKATETLGTGLTMPQKFSTQHLFAKEKETLAAETPEENQNPAPEKQHQSSHKREALQLQPPEEYGRVSHPNLAEGEEQYAQPTTEKRKAEIGSVENASSLYQLLQALDPESSDYPILYQHYVGVERPMRGTVSTDKDIEYLGQKRKETFLALSTPMQLALNEKITGMLDHAWWGS